MRRDRVVLLIGLGIDNVGSGLFLPLSVLYVNQVIGLPLALAGSALTMGSITGLAVPALAGRIVDRVGPKTVLITAQLVQAAGVGGYLLAREVAGVVVAAALLTGGQQLFYCSVFALVADVTDATPDGAAPGARERAFAQANMTRAGSFGLGALGAGLLLVPVGPPGLGAAAVLDVVSFLGAAMLLTTLRVRHPAPPSAAADGGGVLRDRPYLALIATTGLAVAAVDFFLVGFPVFVIERLSGPTWLPGTALVVLATLTGLCGTGALRATRRLGRITALRVGAAGHAVWCALCLAVPLVPTGWRPCYLLAGTAVLAVAGLVFTPYATALSEAAAPRHHRGRYLAAFQYAFTVSHVLTPLLVGLFAVADPLPWLFVGGAALVAVIAFPVVGRQLAG